LHEERTHKRKTRKKGKTSYQDYMTWNSHSLNSNVKTTSIKNMSCISCSEKLLIESLLKWIKCFRYTDVGKIISEVKSTFPFYRQFILHFFLSRFDGFACSGYFFFGHFVLLFWVLVQALVCEGWWMVNVRLCEMARLALFFASPRHWLFRLRDRDFSVLSASARGSDS